MPRARWLPEDDLRLTEVWKDPAALKTQIDKFPGRTELALIHRGAELKLPDRRLFANAARSVATTFARIEKLIKARPGSMEEIAVRANVSKATVRRFITANRGEMHILKYRPRAENGYRAAVWTWGPGKDAVRPKAKTPNEIALAYYRRNRRDPVFKANRAARERLRHAVKTGQFVRRDPAAIALFGAPPPKAASSEASPC